MSTFIPGLTDVQAYLGDRVSWDVDAITDALNAELAAQSRVCKIPHATDSETGDDLGADYTDAEDLAEALYRRVAHNLALRALPLGVQVTMSDVNAATNRVGGTDAEVRRLERPWRKVVVG